MKPLKDIKPLCYYTLARHSQSTTVAILDDLCHALQIDPPRRLSPPEEYGTRRTLGNLKPVRVNPDGVPRRRDLSVVPPGSRCAVGPFGGNT